MNHDMNGNMIWHELHDLTWITWLGMNDMSWPITILTLKRRPKARLGAPYCFFFNAFIFWYVLSFEAINKLNMFFGCDIPMPQDAGTPSLSLLHIFNLYIISIAVLENVPSLDHGHLVKGEDSEAFSSPLWSWYCKTKTVDARPNLRPHLK
jgi:hypothetical protein